MPLKSYTVQFGTYRTIHMKYRRRECVSVQLNVMNGSTPYDLSDCTVYAEAVSRDGTVIVPFHPEIDSPESGGVILFNGMVDETTTPQVGKWDILLVLPDGTTLYLMGGRFTVADSATDMDDDVVVRPTGINIQGKITAAYGRGALTLPHGETEITTTLTTQNKTGLTVNGHGNSWSFNPNSSQMGSRSAVVWATSSTTLPMVNIAGGAQSSWRDMSICGDSWNDTHGGKPTAGFLVSALAGLGSGKHTFNNVSIQKCATAFQAGTAVGDDNCDMCAVSNCRIRQCDKGFYSKNSQAMAWTFDKVLYEAYTDGVFFDFEAGGNLIARNPVAVSRCSILRLNQIYTGTSTGIGANNADYNIYDLKTDDLAKGTTIVNVPSAAGSHAVKANINFFGGHISGNAYSYAGEGKRLMILRGGPRVKLDGMWITIGADNSIEWHTTGDSYTTSILIVGCRLAVTSIAAMFNSGASDGPINVIAFANVGGSGAPLSDVNVTISGTL